jgi:hypothetical protein
MSMSAATRVKSADQAYHRGQGDNKVAQPAFIRHAHFCYGTLSMMLRLVTQAVLMYALQISAAQR